MNYGLFMQYGKMCPDYIHPALVEDAEDIARDAGQSRARKIPPASFAEVMTFAAEFYEGIAVQTSSRSFPRLGLSGLMERGHFLTLDSLASHSADEDYSEYSLTDTLERWGERTRKYFSTEEEFNAYLRRYFLSPTACRGILRRAEKRGRELPPALMEALTQIAKQNTAD